MHDMIAQYNKHIIYIFYMFYVTTKHANKT